MNFLIICILSLICLVLVEAKIVGDLSIISIDELVPMLASFCFFSLLCSNIHTVNGISKGKTVGGLSIIPFVCLYINSILWTSYGLLRNLMPVYLPNGIAIPVSIFCLVVYNRYSIKNNIKYFGLITLTSFLTAVLFHKRRVEDLGNLSCLLSIALSASPLSVVRTVIKEKSTASLPFFTSLFIWFASALWSFYGIFIVHDMILIVPNVLSLFLTSIQLFLFVIYGIQTDTTKGYTKNEL